MFLRVILVAIVMVTVPCKALSVSNSDQGVPTPSISSVPQQSGSTDIHGPAPSESYPYHDQLSEFYTLYWHFNDTHITFEVVVKTKGWVGFGISPKGAMASSDVVIGWVKDGQVTFADRHAEGHFLPAKDSSQDWTLLMGQEVGEYTILKMVRKLDTCDDQDLPILKGTTRVIYTHSPVDPATEDAIYYHGNNRGTKSLLLLDPPSTDQKDSSLPSDVKTLEFLNRNLSVPSSDTTYWCTMWKLPDLGGKHHMIRYEPVIQPGHENLLHHIILYYCNEGISLSSADRTSFPCYDNSPVQSNQCYGVLAAWAIGGKVFNYPSHVGYPMGGSGDPGYFKMETHYDNPDMRSDFVDNSGLRLYITSQIRQHDAGVLSAGVTVEPYQIIPPYEKSFMSRGYCGASCLGEALGKQEIRVFSNLLHAHLLGVRLRTRHFRNGTELAPIQEDNNYDFNYQEMRYLEKERVIKKGDSLLVECEYDSTGRDKITFGGLSSRNEMCLSFLLYYPRNTLSHCESRIGYKIPELYSNIDPIIMAQTINWTKPASHKLFKISIGSEMAQSCLGTAKQFQSNNKYVQLPDLDTPYMKPSVCPVP